MSLSNASLVLNPFPPGNVPIALYYCKLTIPTPNQFVFGDFYDFWFCLCTNIYYNVKLCVHLFLTHIHQIININNIPKCMHAIEPTWTSNISRTLPFHYNITWWSDKLNIWSRFFNPRITWKGMMIKCKWWRIIELSC